MYWATSIQALGTEVAVQTYCVAIYVINLREELHNVCPMLASNCALSLRTWSHKLLPMPPNNHPGIYRQFKTGYFNVQKMKNVFSALANAPVSWTGKGTDSRTWWCTWVDCLERWMVTMPEISCIISEFERICQTANDSEKSHKHDEQYRGVQNKLCLTSMRSSVCI